MDGNDIGDANVDADVRRTRSGRPVRLNATPQQNSSGKKTKKKMVLVEVEVSEDEDETEQLAEAEGPANQNTEDSNSAFNAFNNETSSNAFMENSNSMSEPIQDECTANSDGKDNFICQDSTSVQSEEYRSKFQVQDANSVDNMDVDVEPKADAAAKSDATDGVRSRENSVERKVEKKEAIDADAENISEDELPTVQAVKVPETEEVSDEELPGPKLAELPADTEVVSEDELPAVKKEVSKRKHEDGSDSPDGDGGSAKKHATESVAEEKSKSEDKASKSRKLPELEKYWKAVNDDPTDFTGWTYLLQFVDQENDVEAAREAYDAFLSHYPYCYGYWRKYADYEKRKGNKKKCEEVFERGLRAVPLSVDLWLHYLNYVRSARPDEEEFIRSQYEKAVDACGLEFRSDRLWEGYLKWETDGKRYQNVTYIYDRLLATPTQGYTNHFDNFQEHVASHQPNKILAVDEFLALRKEIRNVLKQDATSETPDSNAPPGEDETKSDEEINALRERIVSIRRKIHKTTVNAVTVRWNFEEGIKRPYFHVKPLERCQLKNWKEYLDYEVEQKDKDRIIVLFERCLIACALYEEFWLRYVHHLESLEEPEMKAKIRDVYERACTIHHVNKPSLHLQWAMFEESESNFGKAAEILVNVEKSVPNLLQVAYRRINLERRKGDFDKCSELYEHYITNSKNKMVCSNLAIKYARFLLKLCKDQEKAEATLNAAIEKDGSNPRLYLQLIDLTLQKEGISEEQVIDHIERFLSKESADVDQKVLFAQRKLEFLEDFGSDIHCVQKAYDDYQKYCKLSKEKKKKDETKGDSSPGKKAKDVAMASNQNSYSFGNYGAGATPGSYQYSAGSSNQYGQYGYSQGDQYGYQNWQYTQSGYGGYNQWNSYGSYY